jgi:hypothetical protein
MHGGSLCLVCLVFGGVSLNFQQNHFFYIYFIVFL